MFPELYCSPAFLRFYTFENTRLEFPNQVPVSSFLFSLKPTVGKSDEAIKQGLSRSKDLTDHAFNCQKYRENVERLLALSSHCELVITALAGSMSQQFFDDSVSSLAETIKKDPGLCSYIKELTKVSKKFCKDIKEDITCEKFNKEIAYLTGVTWNKVCAYFESQGIKCGAGDRYPMDLRENFNRYIVQVSAHLILGQLHDYKSDSHPNDWAPVIRAINTILKQDQSWEVTQASKEVIETHRIVFQMALQICNYEVLDSYFAPLYTNRFRALELGSLYKEKIEALIGGLREQKDDKRADRYAKALG